MCFVRVELVMVFLIFLKVELIRGFINVLGFKIIREILIKINCILGRYIIIIFFF